MSVAQDRTDRHPTGRAVDDGESGSPLEAESTSLGILALTAGEVVLLNASRSLRVDPESPDYHFFVADRDESGSLGALNFV